MHTRQWPDGEEIRNDGGTLLVGGDNGDSVRSTDNAVETWTGRQAKTL